MRQRRLPLAGSFAAALMTAGCATSLVNAGYEDAAHPMREVGNMNRPLQGVFLGTTTVAQQEYVRILLPDARQSCQRTEPLELLLPSSPDAQSRGILRESSVTSTDGRPHVPVYGTITARPPQLPPLRPAEENEAILPWLTTLDIGDAAISPVVIGYEGRLGIVAMYKLGGARSPVRTRRITVQSHWACRSHLRQVLMAVLYLPAAAFDLATFPVLLIVMIVTGH